MAWDSPYADNISSGDITRVTLYVPVQHLCGLMPQWKISRVQQVIGGTMPGHGDVSLTSHETFGVAPPPFFTSAEPRHDEMLIFLARPELSLEDVRRLSKERQSAEAVSAANPWGRLSRG